MTNRRDTRSGAFGGRDRLSPSQHTRIGNGMRCVAPTLEPQSETDGVPVIDWTVVHAIFYADRDAYTGLTARVRAWRWYDKQRDGQSGATGDEVGRWVFDGDTIVALDPALAGSDRGADIVWQTRGASKMYWQIVEIYDEAGDAPATYPWVLVQPFGLARNDDPVSVALFDTSSGGALPCCPPEYTRMAAVGATHWSPNDGSSVFKTATTLQTAGWPFVPDNANCNVLGIMVRDKDGVVTEYINGHNGVSMSAVGGVITMTGAGAAPFAATDMNVYVYLCYQDKAVMAPMFWAQPATHWTPNNGTATRVAATQVTTAGFPFVVDNANCYILGIVIRRAAGTLEEYVNGQNGFRFSAGADLVTLTGAGAAPFLVTDLNYYLYVLYEQKAYTEASDSLRTEEIAPLNHEHTQPAYIYNDLDIQAAGPINIPSDDGVVMDGYKDIQFQLHLVGGKTDVGANCVATLKFQGSNDLTIAGVREWVDLAVGYDLGSDSTQATWTSTGLTATDAEIDFDNWMGKRIRVQLSFDVAPEANDPGECVITERRKAL